MTRREGLFKALIGTLIVLLGVVIGIGISINSKEEAETPSAPADGPSPSAVEPLAPEELPGYEPPPSDAAEQGSRMDELSPADSPPRAREHLETLPDGRVIADDCSRPISICDSPWVAPDRVPPPGAFGGDRSPPVG